ncbi:MAG: biotin/lipoyl-containing protein [Kiritimatiellia bacterium]
MIKKVKIPKLSANVNEVTVTSWLAGEGEKVRKGDAIAELTTEKAAFELEAPCSGVLRSVLAAEKSVVPTGYIVALIGPLGDKLPDVSGSNRKLMEKHRSAAVERKPRRQRSRLRERIRATPAARRLAAEMGVDLKDVRKQTESETITEEDVKRFANEMRGAGRAEPPGRH